MFLHAEPAAGHRVALAGEHARPDYFGHPRGDEFLAYLKLNELFKQIPVVMLSSEDSTSERIRLLEEGAEDYIVKPFNPQELKIRIKKILD